MMRMGMRACKQDVTYRPSKKNKMMLLGTILRSKTQKHMNLNEYVYGYAILNYQYGVRENIMVCDLVTMILT